MLVHRSFSISTSPTIKRRGEVMDKFTPDKCGRFYPSSNGRNLEIEELYQAFKERLMAELVEDGDFLSDLVVNGKAFVRMSSDGVELISHEEVFKSVDEIEAEAKRKEKG
jgi:hypothetical protein